MAAKTILGDWFSLHKQRRCSKFRRPELLWAGGAQQESSLPGGHIWGKTLHFSAQASATVRENVPNDSNISHLFNN